MNVLNQRDSRRAFLLYLGNFVTKRVKLLRENNIPTAVTGGMICSLTLALLAVLGDVQITFDLAIRDTLLLVFFSTIGLGAKLRMLAAGGKALAILLLGCAPGYC